MNENQQINKKGKQKQHAKTAKHLVECEDWFIFVSIYFLVSWVEAANEHVRNTFGDPDI